MTIAITPIDPARPDFAGRVDGIDLRQPPTPADITAIEAGMDRFAVLLFRDQPLDDAQQLDFTARLGPWKPPAAT